MLNDRDWRFKYTSEDGDLVRVFYVPALQDTERYDRLTGYFDAGPLALAARGVAGLVRNDGRMRLVVGCTLDHEEIDAIRESETSRHRVERRLAELPLAPPDTHAAHALELLARMIGRGHLHVRLAVPCDANSCPIEGRAILHEKSTAIEDRAGYKIAWTGSLIETTTRWQRKRRTSIYTFTFTAATPPPGTTSPEADAKARCLRSTRWLAAPRHRTARRRRPARGTSLRSSITSTGVNSWPRNSPFRHGLEPCV